MLVLFILSLIYLVMRYRATLRTLRPVTAAGVAFLFLLTAAAAFISFYYGVDWIAANLNNIFLLVFLQFLLLFLLIAFCLGILHSLLRGIEKKQKSKKRLGQE